jgi:hypothetical protein
MPMDPTNPEQRDGLIQRLEALHRQGQALPLPASPEALRASADLAGRLARVEEILEELGASMGLLHTKMETIIAQLAAQERPEEPGPEA